MERHDTEKLCIHNVTKLSEQHLHVRDTGEKCIAATSIACYYTVLSLISLIPLYSSSLTL